LQEILEEQELKYLRKKSKGLRYDQSKASTFKGSVPDGQDLQRADGSSKATQSLSNSGENDSQEKERLKTKARYNIFKPPGSSLRRSVESKRDPSPFDFNQDRRSMSSVGKIDPFNRSNTQSNSLQMNSLSPKKKDIRTQTFMKQRSVIDEPLKLDRIFEVNGDSKSDYMRTLDFEEKLGPVRRRSKDQIELYDQNERKKPDRVVIFHGDVN
jgi:hypothetical protein